jgi:hypothetical protein
MGKKANLNQNLLKKKAGTSGISRKHDLKLGSK